jgi:3-phosphoshikimate 1-carboxyvinyltransferase
MVASAARPMLNPRPPPNHFMAAMSDAESPLQPLSAHNGGPLSGRFATPGDKAISHRALIAGALAVGRTSIHGLLIADDVLATANALRALGVAVDMDGTQCVVQGLGINGLLAPAAPLDFGNSGTGARLMLGLLAPYRFTSQLTGSATLTRRPMQSLFDALGAMGMNVLESAGGQLPATIRGPATAVPIYYVAPEPSEQIKSALLLAGLAIPGTTTIVEPVPTPDHTETMLAAFGADIVTSLDETGTATIRLTGLPELKPRRVIVPGDPSAAAYAIVAALIVPGSDLVIENVLMINSNRTGLIDTLLEMGGDIAFTNQREAGGEHVADLRVRSSRLRGVRVPAEHARAMLDDIPALAVAAAYADGSTAIEGIASLREQECDRLAAIAAGLAANGIECLEGRDQLLVKGAGAVPGGGRVETQGDHRIAMSFLVLGFASTAPIAIDDARPIAASFPGFVAAMNAAGANIATA